MGVRDSEAEPSACTVPTFLWKRYCRGDCSDGSMGAGDGRSKPLASPQSGMAAKPQLLSQGQEAEQGVRLNS